MNSARKHAVTAFLIISIAGCADKKAKTAPPAQAQAPAIPAAGKAGALYPPPLTQSQTQTEQPAPAPPPVVAKSEPEPAPQPPPPVPNKRTSRKQKPSAAKPAAPVPGTAQPAAPDAAPSTSPASTAPAGGSDPATDVAANGEPASSSPIGELTTSKTPGQAQKGKDANDIITNTENGLSGIKRSLSTQEQETAGQIKTFLSKARAALDNGDVDGAYILATKAKVLLDELNKT